MVLVPPLEIIAGRNLPVHSVIPRREKVSRVSLALHWSIPSRPNTLSTLQYSLFVASVNHSVDGRIRETRTYFVKGVPFPERPLPEEAMRILDTIGERLMQTDRHGDPMSARFLVEYDGQGKESSVARYQTVFGDYPERASMERKMYGMVFSGFGY